MSKQNSNLGFTLVEVLVAIVIVGILGVIALPQYNRLLERFRYAEVSGILSPLSRAQERYFLLNSRYAERFADLDIDLHKISGEIATDEIFTTRNFEFSLEDVNETNTLVKIYRKKNGVTLYSIYKDLRRGTIYCEDVNLSDKITCDQLGVTEGAVTCANGTISIGNAGCPREISPVLPVTGCFPQLCSDGFMSDCSGVCVEVNCPDGTVLHSSPEHCPTYTCWDGSTNRTGLEYCPPQI